MGSFSASSLLSLQLFWKPKVKLKTMTEQSEYYIEGIVIIKEKVLIGYCQEVDEMICSSCKELDEILLSCLWAIFRFTHIYREFTVITKYKNKKYKVQKTVNIKTQVKRVKGVLVVLLDV